MKRPNGTGYIYKRGSTWTARVVDHYEHREGKLCPVYKTKGGFKTKRDAINYIPTLYATARIEHKPQTFAEDFARWRDMYEGRISEKTMEGYKGAFKHLAPVHHITVDKISAVNLQECLDNCKAGKRTRELMKVTANMVFKFAQDDDQINRNPAANLYTGDGETKHYEPLTEEQLEKIEKSGLPYAEYIVAMCYLGHRPSEFFGFKKSDYHVENDVPFIAGGVKTTAGKTRTVTIPPKVLPIIQARLAVEGTDLLFPRYNKNRKGEPTGFSQMPERYFNKFVWKPIMDALGIVGKVPYAARHTYANKIKRATGDEKDKAELMGHASYETTRKHYQTTTLNEQKAITDQIG